jgi:hypothetical protein
MSPASWRRAGTTHWSAWAGLSGESRSYPPCRRRAQRSIAHVSSSLPTICRRHGMHLRPIRGASKRLIHILVQEIVCELDDATNEAVLLIHWTGGRHTEVRVPRVKAGRYPSDMAPTAVEVIRKRAVSSPSRSTGCAARRAMARPGQRSVCAKCASVSVSRNMIRPKLTVR